MPALWRVFASKDIAATLHRPKGGWGPPRRGGIAPAGPVSPLSHQIYCLNVQRSIIAVSEAASVLTATWPMLT